MSGYKRNLENKINTLLDQFPVVLLLGVRQCGKTTLAKKIRPDWAYFDLEKGSDFDRITSDFDFFFKEYSQHVIIDEAQESPQLFKELRGVLDANKKKNRFILTGSSSAELLRTASESLAGRIAILELGTLKFNEYCREPLPAFYRIFEKSIDKESIGRLKEIPATGKSKRLLDFFLKGGYPEPVWQDNKSFHDNWMEYYFKTYIERDIRKLFPKLNIVAYRRFIQILSALSGTILNRSEVGRTLDTSEVTVKEYLDIAHHSYVWRNIPSYEQSKSKSTLKKPKGNFRDSGLRHFLQGISDGEKLSVHPTTGAAFEAFVIEELIKGLEATSVTRWDYHYYRTKNGAEVDLILTGSFGILPVEIKYGIQTNASKLASLKRFVQQHDLPLGIVINNSDEVSVIGERLIQIPASLV